MRREAIASFNNERSFRQMRDTAQALAREHNETQGGFERVCLAAKCSQVCQEWNNQGQLISHSKRLFVQVGEVSGQLSISVEDATE